MLRRKPKNTADAKYDTILTHETAWAYGTASALHAQRPITVWEVLIPIFLVFNFAKTRGDRQFLAQNLMFTKQLALDGAMDIVKRGTSREEAMEQARSKTDEILHSEHNGLYSEHIQRSQLREIELLVDHYCRLLRSNGTDYRSLVTTAYMERWEYDDFLDKLKNAEKEVSTAAMETLGSRGDPEFTARMERHAARLRKAAADRIFSA